MKTNSTTSMKSENKLKIALINKELVSKVLILLFIASAVITSTRCSERNEDDPTNPKAEAVAIEMVHVKGGTFTMGCTTEQEDDCRNDEIPDHEVILSDFYIGKYEVTQKQWKAVMGNNPSFFKGDSLPVEDISWNDIQNFIIKLNIKTGKKYRLPTEAEWEYAARGGNKSKGYKYSGSDNIYFVAWYGDNSHYSTHAVGTLFPNELGIYDMSGNVEEWCNDWYARYSDATQTNPKGPSIGEWRVFRGGSYYDKGKQIHYMRVSYRACNPPNEKSDRVGFRLALD